MLNCWRNTQYSIDWSLIPTFLIVSESPLWCWRKLFMLLSAVPETVEKNQTPKRISSPVLQATTALAVRDMVFLTSIWISDLLVSVCNEEKAKSCIHLCVPLSSMILGWNCWVPADVHITGHRITGTAVTGVCKVSFHIIKPVFHFCSHIYYFYHFEHLRK